eukprot:scaffold2047_cov71-Phaeocystis_antarctica.AAC.2
MWLWGQVGSCRGRAQEEMVPIALAVKKLWWPHRACVAQDRGRPCKEELVHDHADRNQHAN